MYRVPGTRLLSLPRSGLVRKITVVTLPGLDLVSNYVLYGYKVTAMNYIRIGMRRLRSHVMSERPDQPSARKRLTFERREQHLTTHMF